MLKRILLIFSFRSLFTVAAPKMRIENNKIDGLVIFHPEEGQHSATVVLMHGIGDSAQGLSNFGNTLARSLPHIKFILPTAKNRPVTIFGNQPANAWFDALGTTDKASEPCDGIEESTRRVYEFLAAEHIAGLPYSRMALAGFSQGAGLSLCAGLQLPSAEQKLAGLLILAGFLPAANKFRLTSGLEGTEIFHAHGTADTRVSIQVLIVSST